MIDLRLPLLSLLLLNVTTVASTTDQMILQECAALSIIIKTLPTEIAPSIQARIEILSKTAQTPDELHLALVQLREEILQNNKTRFTNPSETVQQAIYSFDGVWQALVWCGVGCGIFLCISALQDADARMLNTKTNKTHIRIEKNHELIHEAAIQTIALAQAINKKDAV